MAGVTRENNFIYLTVSLVVLLMASAALDSLPDENTHLFLQMVIFGTLVIVGAAIGLS